MSPVRLLVALFAVLSTVSFAAAQRGVEDTTPAFDVASIKLSAQPTREVIAHLIAGTSVTLEPGGRWVVRYATLRQILRRIYPDYSIGAFPNSDRIVGGPPWADSQHFDIDARTNEHTSADGVMRMARRLLSDRFKLVLGNAMRPIDVYALVISRADKRLGPGVRPAVDCVREPILSADHRPIPNSRQNCRLALTVDGNVARLSAGASPISDLIGWLQLRVDRPIVDRTGLTGEFALRFEVPLGETRTGNAGVPIPFAHMNSDIFALVREQLGLTLVSRREPMSVLTIDRVEMPVPN